MHTLFFYYKSYSTFLSPIPESLKETHFIIAFKASGSISNLFKFNYILRWNKSSRR